MPLSTIFQQSVLLVDGTGVPRENHLVPQITDKFYHIMLNRVHLSWAGSNVNGDWHWLHR